MTVDYTDKKQRIKFYKSKEWRNIRQRVLERDRFECIWCRDEGEFTIEQQREKRRNLLEIDHIKELEHYPGLRLDMDNLRTLCVRHHNLRHNRFYKKEDKWGKEKW